jgi:putative endopeptidase
MIRLVYVLAATSSLAGCAVQPAAVSPALPVAPVPVAAAAPPVADAEPEIGTFGFDVAGMDRSVAPGDDWVEFANGSFLRNLQIPADRSSYGMFHRLDDLSRARTREIIEAAARESAAAGTNAQKVGDFYSAFMDEAAIEARGAAPL